MQIKQRLQINVAVSVLMAIVIFLVLFLLLLNLNKANNSARISGDLITSVLERVTLRNDYMRNNSARAKEQLFAKHEEIGGLLKSAAEYFKDSEDNKNITEMIESHASIGKIFFTIVAIREKSGLDAGSANLSSEVEERLLSQLNMRVYDVVLDCRKLLESSRKARESALRQAGWGIISALLIMIIVAIINSRTMGRAITDRVQRLREGAVLIGGGDLNHRINVKGDDEFAALAESFNTMTAKLSGNYHELEYEIKERKQAEEKVKASLAEKEVLLKEIHHRVKNNLQVISSLVSLQADGSKDEAVRQVLRDVTYRVRSMAMVHEKLYQSADLASIDFAEYARGLLGYLWRAHGATAAAVRLTLDLAPVSLQADTAVTCGLILNELAVNALEHAFQGRTDGEVAVSLQSDEDDRVRLCMCDNGVGLPAGFDWRKTSSLGLRLVQMLAKQLDGEVQVSGDGGTKFEISFKVDRLTTCLEEH